MNATYLRTEVRRTLRAPRYFVFVIGMPVGLFLLFSSLYGTGTQDGVAAKAWLMVSMSVFGAMGAAVSIGGRIAGERQAGWTRQLRLTPMPGRTYVASKAVTALPSPSPPSPWCTRSARWSRASGCRPPGGPRPAGWSLLALAPFVALGIWLGHRLTVDVLGPLSGALFTALGILGGVWFPIDQLPSAHAGTGQGAAVVLAGPGRAGAAGRLLDRLARGGGAGALDRGVRGARRPAPTGVTPRAPRFDTVATRSAPATDPAGAAASGRVPARVRRVDTAGSTGANRWRLFSGVWLLYLLPGVHHRVDRAHRRRPLAAAAPAGRVLLRLRRPGRPRR